MATYNRGHLKSRLAAGNANILTPGDSITLPYNGWSVQGAMNMRWPYPCRGARVGNQNSGGAGYPIQVTSYSGGASGTHLLVRPGDVTPDGDSGANVMQCGFCNATQDITNFGSPINVLINPTGTNIPNWDENKNVEILLTGRTDPIAANPDLFRIQYWNRANSFIGELSSVDFDQARADRFWKTNSFATGTGVFNTRARLSTWNENELNALIKTCTFGVRVVGSTGIFWGYMGHGSWGIRNHSTQAGNLITQDAPTYTGRIDDNAIQNDYAAYQWNYVLIMLGANDAALTKEQWKAHAIAMIDRHKTLAGLAGVSDLKFGFATQYDLSDDNTLTVQKAEACEELSKEDADVECFDVRQHVFDTFGAHSVWRATLTHNNDGVHPSITNPALRNSIADFILAAANGPVHSSVPAQKRISLSLGIGL